MVPADPGERTFGQRMVLSDTTDEDGLPTMPPAQRIIIVICILLAACAVAYVALTRAGVIG